MNIRLVLSTAAIALALTACGEAATASPMTQEATPVATATPAPTVTIKIDAFYSATQTTTVKRGTTVRFLPAGDYKLQLFGDLKTPMFGAEGYVTTFDQAGTFTWHSGLHAGCHGAVVVQ